MNITGGSLRFVTASDGTAPALNLAAAVGPGGGAFGYNLGLPLVLDAATAFQGSGTAALTVAGPITGAGGIVKSSSGALVLSGANAYTGATTVSAGTLTISANTALGTAAGVTTIPSGGGQLALIGGISVAEPLTINGRTSGDQLVNSGGNNSLTGTLTLATGGNGYFLRADADKLTVSGSLNMNGSTASKTLTVSGAGNVELSGTVGNDAGSLALTKTGTGTLTLSGTNSYTGATAVSAGTLAVNSNLAASSGVTVAAGATLTGGGTVGTATVINGTHAPGVGTQTFSGALTYGATSHLAWALAGNTAAGSGVNAGSVMVTDGAAVDIVPNPPGGTVDFTNAFWQGSHTWTALSATSLGGRFTLGRVGADANGRAASAYGLFSLAQTGTAVSILWTPLTSTLAWRYRYFGADWNNAAVAGDTADPDGDGVVNLLEYALGRSPVAADGTGVRVMIDKDNLVMIYSVLKSATDIAVQPEWSADAISWSNQNITCQVLADDGTIQTIQATVPRGSNAKLFMRLRVNRP